MCGFWIHEFGFRVAVGIETKLGTVSSAVRVEKRGVELLVLSSSARIE